MICKDCPFYSGTTCHGHGEYFGTCSLKVLKFGRYCWETICNDDTKCSLSNEDIEKIKNVLENKFIKKGYLK